MGADVYDYNDENLPQENTTSYSFDLLDPLRCSSAQINWVSDAENIVSPIAIFVGVFTNIFAVVVLVKGRLWLKHEGYVFLAANFCVNVGVLLVCTSSFWITSSNEWVHYYPPNSSTFMCKVWYFLMSILFAYGWLCVALLVNVYQREHLILRRRCGCSMFASKYCTLLASKIVVGIIFSVLVVFGVPSLVRYELHDGACTWTGHWNFHAVLISEWIVMWVLPMVVFLPIILLMTLCTKREGKTFEFSQIEERSVSDDQMRVVAVTLSTIHLSSQFAMAFTLFVRGNYTLVILELCYSLSIASQPILCFIILKTLREGFFSQLRNIRCCRLLSPSLDLEEEAVQLNSVQEGSPRETELRFSSVTATYSTVERQFH